MKLRELGPYDYDMTRSWNTQTTTWGAPSSRRLERPGDYMLHSKCLSYILLIP